jgi:ribosome maturation factor RimP
VTPPSVAERVSDLALPMIERQGAYLVELVIRGHRGNTVVEVFADTDSGITTEQCASISHELSRALDLAEVFRHQYNLVVSSPGLDRPLKLFRQYQRHIGRDLAVTMRNTEGEIKLTGELLGVSPEGIVLQGKDDKEQTIPLDVITEAKVLPAW